MLYQKYLEALHIQALQTVHLLGEDVRIGSYSRGRVIDPKDKPHVIRGQLGSLPYLVIEGTSNSVDGQQPGYWWRPDAGQFVRELIGNVRRAQDVCNCIFDQHLQCRYDSGQRVRDERDLVYIEVPGNVRVSLVPRSQAVLQHKLIVDVNANIFSAAGVVRPLPMLEKGVILGDVLCFTVNI